MKENETPEEIEALKRSLGDYFTELVRQAEKDPIVLSALLAGQKALAASSLSLARVNQILHLCSQAGMSGGFYRYYFLESPNDHPYPVGRVFDSRGYAPPSGATQIASLQQLHWGIHRFILDAMLYWGNFREAYRQLRGLDYEALVNLFAMKRIGTQRLLTRGTVTEPASIPRDDRYLISEMACKTYEAKSAPEQLDHVKLALEAFEMLRKEGKQITPSELRRRTEELAKKSGQVDLFELLFEDATAPVIRTREEVIALYTGQWTAFQNARAKALDNTNQYLSICNDLDVYVATSMRGRQDFRDMAATCDRIFGSPRLKQYNLRYFDPTLSAAEHHEDKGIIECLMVKAARVILYFAQHKESLGKVSEYAMGLSLGKPVIILCPSDDRGTEIYHFYQTQHPLTRLVVFKTGLVNGAMITTDINVVVQLLDRIFSNQMEYSLCKKANTDAYYLLRERLSESTVRIVTDNRLLTETFWNNYHNVN
ncbi:MAG: hypothetical protein ACLPTZ_21925 [Beijerinckiaceae bacterium]